MVRDKSSVKQQNAGSFEFKDVPVPLKVFGALCVLVGVGVFPFIVFRLFEVIEKFSQGKLTGTSLTSSIIMLALIVLLITLTVFSILLGIRLFRNKRRNAASTTNTLIIVTVVAILCDMMLSGLNFSDISYIIILALWIALSSFLDPSLSVERKAKRKLRRIEERAVAESLGNRVGRDPSGKGYISLNFFNLFWLFVVSSIIGLIIETLYHLVAYGEYQDRAGMLFGPFSPIYGFGGILMTLALNRVYKKSFVFIFFASAIIGGAFEYLVSWFMEFAFGITAWNYTGTWLSIGDGRTSGIVMILWGVLGLVWIKILLPQMLKLINRIPWNWRYTFTSVFATAMIINGAATLMAFDLWYSRESGKLPETTIELVFADYFGDEYMKSRFQSMSIDPNNATRTEFIGFGD